MTCRDGQARLGGALSLGLALLLIGAAAVPGVSVAQDTPTEEPPPPEQAGEASPAMAETADTAADTTAAPDTPGAADEADTAAGAGQAGEANAANEADAADPGAGRDRKGKAGEDDGRPVVIGTRPQAEVQSCQSRWESCNERVRKNLDIMWQMHRTRRESCDKALKEFETACAHPEEPRPKRCRRRAQSDWRNCDSTSNRDHLRELKQVQRQRQACDQAYRICVGI